MSSFTKLKLYQKFQVSVFFLLSLISILTKESSLFGQISLLVIQKVFVFGEQILYHLLAKIMNGVLGAYMTNDYVINCKYISFHPIG